MEAAQCVLESRDGQDDLLKLELSIRMGKEEDLREFDCSMVVGARQDGLSIFIATEIFPHNHVYGL